MSPKPKRKILEKDDFMSGNRQKWAAIFCSLGVVIMVCSAYGWLKNPEPFLQFFLSIGVTFILGASASDVMKSWKTTSVSENQNMSSTETITTTESKTVDINKKEDVDINHTYSENIKIEGQNAPERKPFAREATEE